MWLMRSEEDETTWEEYSEFHKDLKLSFTVSEFDFEPKVEVFCKEQNIADKVHGSVSSATNFLSQYQILTHQAQVKMPSGKIDLPLIEDNFDGTIRVQYNPKEDGVHELILLHNGAPVQGSPYKFHVDSQSSGCLTAYGPGLSGGKCGEPCVFTISTKGAEVPLLSLSVEGPSKAKISYTDNKDGTILVTFLPTEAGDYKISVRFGDKHIAGSPFVCKVEGDAKKSLRNQLSIGSGCSQVTLPGVLTDADLRSLNAIIMTPSGIEEPCFLKRLPSGNIGISFTPRETGEHTVSVKRMGIQIKNSPFKINVTDKEVGNAKKVKVTGTALTDGKTHTDNTFVIDTRDAGYGGLSLSIEGPSKAQIKCLDQIDGTLKISYKPTLPGNYILNLKFADHHVEGSPFNINVTGEGNNSQRENISQQTSAVPSNDVGSKCKLTFKMPGITSFDLAASVTSPKGICQDAEVQEIEDGLYAVHFVPKEEGIHTISVKYTDIHIPGSPFQFTVGPFSDSGSHLVKAGGSGLEFGEVGVPAEFNIWTREAGEGKIAISIEGPSKAEINFKDRKDGSCNVAYTVKEPGEYNVSLKFNERHIPDSPFIVKFTPPAADAHKVEIAQFPQGAIQTNTPSQFLVRKNGAKGDIDAKIVSPSNLEDDCFVQAIDSEETSVRFYPREEGIHAIHVKLNGVHIPGSPYRVRVGKDVADASAVKAEGVGLKDAVTGQKSHFLISTLDAGSGTLSVTMDGPAKVSLDCTEIDDGYKARYTPFLPGEYFVSVKYNNTHIVGSPFRVNCTGKSLVDEGGQESTSVSVQTTAKHSKGNKNGPALPVFNADASKVTIKGMGIKKAFVGKQNQFTVNASEAGHSILFVGLYNPKGPCEEVQVKHTGKNTFTVNYYIRERGEYTLLVMWGENHIPGSPFLVEVPSKC
ncbi:filamin-A isoform X3 [Contarinia nasturtii]|uniref:filamin-A isoform X3 n=1 Tax=Contarinia nasturtii TaxID=265458 RepID=UPI0012D47FD5|nr:filamin-A isoform X3 [Contarinia nasturtii]XP_031619595.1 filamin-A isoform X3 [Contarinia nasturtii]XP_031619596.1 filamin-A isoform X3 [Contarinia nasturtii]XP_031619597.1 filamin-A isoform X3 [Contarinia nasturtii]